MPQLTPTRATWKVLICVQVGCLLAIVLGLISMASPFWFYGGIIGWANGFDAKQEDPLLMQWMFFSGASVFVGLVFAVGGTAIAMTFGIATGLLGLSSAKQKRQLKAADVEIQPLVDQDATITFPAPENANGE